MVITLYGSNNKYYREQIIQNVSQGRKVIRKSGGRIS